MTQMMRFCDVLDAADNLDDDAQKQLVEILTRRLAERGRARIVLAIEEARREIAAGQGRPMTAEEIVREAWDGFVAFTPKAFGSHSPGLPERSGGYPGNESKNQIDPEGVAEYNLRPLQGRSS